MRLPRLPARWAVVLELPPTPTYPVVVRSPMARAFTRRGACRRYDGVMDQPAVGKALVGEGATLVVRRLDPAGFVRVPSHG